MQVAAPPGWPSLWALPVLIPTLSPPGPCLAPCTLTPAILHPFHMCRKSGVLVSWTPARYINGAIKGNGVCLGDFISSSTFP